MKNIVRFIMLIYHGILTGYCSRLTIPLYVADNTMMKVVRMRGYFYQARIHQFIDLFPAQKAITRL